MQTKSNDRWLLDMKMRQNQLEAQRIAEEERKQALRKKQLELAEQVAFANACHMLELIGIETDLNHLEIVFDADTNTFKVAYQVGQWIIAFPTAYDHELSAAVVSAERPRGVNKLDFTLGFCHIKPENPAEALGSQRDTQSPKHIVYMPPKFPSSYFDVYVSVALDGDWDATDCMNEIASKMFKVEQEIAIVQEEIEAFVAKWGKQTA